MCRGRTSQVDRQRQVGRRPRDAVAAAAGNAERRQRARRRLAGKHCKKKKVKCLSVKRGATSGGGACRRQHTVGHESSDRYSESDGKKNQYFVVRYNFCIIIFVSSCSSGLPEALAACVAACVVLMALVVASAASAAPAPAPPARTTFRFPSESSREPLAEAGVELSVKEARAAGLSRRPAARDSLHGARALAASGWKLLLTDEATKTGAQRGSRSSVGGARCISHALRPRLQNTPTTAPSSPAARSWRRRW